MHGDVMASADGTGAKVGPTATWDPLAGGSCIGLCRRGSLTDSSA